MEREMAERAHRFIAVGGKTFYFNINQTHGGTHNYLTIVAQKGKDSSQNEKMTMFPNQIGSFVHCLLETYAELCRRDEIAMPLVTGPVIDLGGLPAVDMVDPAEKIVPIDKMRCPKCDTGVYDPDSEFSGFLWIYRTGEENAMIAVQCKQCEWHPESETVNEQNGAVFYRSSKEGQYWEKYATWGN